MPAKNNLPGVLGKLDLEKLNHDGQYYGAFEELTRLLDGSHPDILNGVNLGRAASYRQYVKGDKMPYGIANAIAGGIDRANYDKIKRAVLGDSVVDAAEQQRLQKEQEMQEKADRERRELQERRRIESEAQKKAMTDALHKYRDLTPDDLPKILRRISPDRIGRHDTLAGTPSHIVNTSAKNARVKKTHRTHGISTVRSTMFTPALRATMLTRYQNVR